MTFKKSLRLARNTTGTAIRSVIVQMLVIAFVIALVALIVYPTFSSVLDIIRKIDLSTEFIELYNLITNTSFDSVEVANKITYIINLVANSIKNFEGLFVSIYLSYFVLVLAFVVYRFVLSIVDLPIASTLLEFMQTGNNRPFMWFFVKKIGYACKFSICQLLLSFILDIFTFCGIIAMYFAFLTVFRVVGIILIILFGILAYSVRLTILAFWLPEYATNGYKALPALKDGIKKVVDRFGHVLYKTAIIITCWIALSFLTVLLFDTIKVGVIGVVVTLIISYYSFYIIKCINFIEFFEQSHSKYFTKKLHLTPQTETDSISIE
ncbi:MAG: hypothetical protein RR248_04030 [Clostridia bacterium]